MFDKDLGFMLQAAEGRRMDDAVAVALERRAKAGHPLLVKAAARLVGLAGERGKHMQGRSCCMRSHPLYSVLAANG
jgi:hypothetical protein